MNNQFDTLIADNNAIGTADYIGLAYFWSHEMRHEMRDTSAAQRKMMHDALVRLGFNAGGKDYERSFDFTGKSIDVNFCSDDAMFLTIDGIEWYIDNSTNEDIFEII